jgi:hypothetical protein
MTQKRLKVTGIDAAVDRNLEYLSSIKGGASPEAGKSASKRPAMRDLLPQSAANDWSNWLGLPLDASAAPETKVEVVRKIDVVAETTVPVTWRIENLGETSDVPGCVTLVASADIDSTALTSKALEIPEDPSPGAAARKDGDPPLEFEACSARLAAKVVTDPATLRPRSARMEKTVKVKDMGVREKLEWHEYGFEWPRSGGGAAR